MAVSGVRAPDAIQVAGRTVGNPDRIRRVSDLFRTIIQSVNEFIIPLEGFRLTNDLLYTASAYMSAIAILGLARKILDRDEEGNLNLLKGHGHVFTKLGSAVGYEVSNICDTIKLLNAEKLIELGSKAAQLTAFKHHVAAVAAALSIADTVLIAKRNGKIDEKAALSILANSLKIAVISLVVLQQTSTPFFLFTALTYGVVNYTKIAKEVSQESTLKASKIYATKSLTKDLRTL
jgi:hypothetical protein